MNSLTNKLEDEQNLVAQLQKKIKELQVRPPLRIAFIITKIHEWIVHNDKRPDRIGQDLKT